MKRIFIIFGLTLVLSVALIAFAITKDSTATVCPTCKMAIATPDSSFEMKGETGSLFFCSQGCFDKFKADPTAYMTVEEMQVAAGLCLECAKVGGCQNGEHGVHKDAAIGCEGCDLSEAVTPAGDVEPAKADSSCLGDCSDCESEDK